MRIRSLRLGLIGQSDAVEFVRSAEAGDGVALTDRKGHWKPVVVEYKRGSPKIDRCDEVQLCAQVMCLEEMLGVEMSEAAIFYGEPRRRYPVLIDRELRSETTDTIVAVRALLESSLLPVAVDDKRCYRCSLVDECQPHITSRKRSAVAYLRGAIKKQDAES
jgi:CRISPR-associated exonuclease Cas4